MADQQATQAVDPVLAARRQRLEALVAEFGCADDCVPTENSSLPAGEGLPRYALMERDARRSSGGPWWSLGKSRIAVLDASAGQEYPEDWPAETVFDLDTGACWEVRLSYKVGDPIEVGPLDGES